MGGQNVEYDKDYASYITLAGGTIPSDPVSLKGTLKALATTIGASGPSGVFNVKSYGATGDGTTSDTSAVQACVTACVGAGGGEVYFPKGTYVLSNVTFGSNITVRGDGVGVTVLLQDPSVVANGVVARVAPASNVVITSNFSLQNLTIDGNKSAFGNNNNIRLIGFYLGQGPTLGLVNNCSVINCEFRNNQTYGLDVENVTNVQLTNVSSHDNGFRSGTGTHINASGFTLIGDDITAVGCQAYNNAVEGFLCGQDAFVWHRVSLVGCEAWSNGANGFRLNSSTGFGIFDSRVTGCASFSNVAAGIYLQFAFNSSVTGCSSYNNGTDGILLSSSSYCSVAGNTTTNNATASSANPEIYMTNTSTFNSVTGNTVSSTTSTHAVSEQNSSTDHNVITGNVLTSTGSIIVVNGVNTALGINQGYGTYAKTLGDIEVVGASNLPARLPIGTNGQVLTADSGQTNGLAWETPTAFTGGPSRLLYKASTAVVLGLSGVYGVATTFTPDSPAVGMVPLSVAAVWGGAFAGETATVEFIATWSDATTSTFALGGVTTTQTQSPNNSTLGSFMKDGVWITSIQALAKVTSGSTTVTCTMQIAGLNVV